MFKIRTSKPSEWNALYNNGYAGGWSWCITGSPTDPISNVLSNCVGYACSRFNEIYNELTGNSGMKYLAFCCNAEDFIEAAVNMGLSYGMDPKPGSIMCWGGEGALAGHVAIVESVNADGSVYTSESGWNSPAFWNATRWNDGNWGAGYGYWFRGFIYNPAIQDAPVTPVGRDKYRDQINNKAADANVRSSASLYAEALGFAPVGYYNIISTAEADGYVWYQVESGKWIAGGDWIDYLKAEERPAAAIYRVRDNNNYVWFPDVQNDEDFAGLFGDAISGFQMNITKGNVKYTAHVLDKWWMPMVTNREDYAGSEYRGQNIDAICITSDMPVLYRVHLIGGAWLPWVSSKNANLDDAENGYAGIIGHLIDGIQMKLE